ncbi:aldehyde dehydrogenase family protein [Acetobacter sacchari]|uniref:aldehyde dehydrogenase (NAD(+)) n=1 Tax=Acetobacter sacchari TaxID=2661687 RepID=A0ABS3LUN8_9PROT|nr:aldehyde dehydrogenase family protein [Acetobacter sacchari]MBO1359633.1 aldehyde dehydrogenase family protein [Acetobacter sacchari]
MSDIASLDLATQTRDLLSGLGVDERRLSAQGAAIPVRSPVNGQMLGHVASATAEETNATIERAHAAFLAWRRIPAPRRGELVRLLGEELRANKDALGRLVSIEVGKSPSEGLGEVQEMIDICDFAVGLSRQLCGLTIATERAEHRMMETWHPIGVVGIISAFNFPVAVWAWNAALALVCGDSVVWKPSEKTPLTAIATDAILRRAIKRFNASGDAAPDGLAELAVGGRETGAALVAHPRVPLVSATGSTEMGRIVGRELASRFGRAILELGGNNAAIVTPSADLDLALRGVAFAAMGTAGQRCTTLRRLFVHSSVYDAFVPRLKAAFSSVSVGSPLDGHLVGPLIDHAALERMQEALAAAMEFGATVHGGERVDVGAPQAFYARPALVETPVHDGPVLDETFAPILYVLSYDDLEDAIALQNDVPQGLSSAIFTTDLREAELFLSARGSDCGIANVNIGTSGAEIGGAFGGEKATGGGRESGSDSWKGYMRRATNTINYGRDLPLAQGVTFDVG